MMVSGKMKIYAPAATTRNRLNRGNIVWGLSNLLKTLPGVVASRAYLGRTLKPLYEHRPTSKFFFCLSNTIRISHMLIE